MIRFSDLPGVCVRVLGDGAGVRVRVTEARAHGPEIEARAEAAWQRHRLSHPRDYDGTILHVCGVDAARGEVEVCRERYRFLAVGAEAGAGARLLAVTGVITGIDQDGDECVLLGRRSAETRIYGGMWELGPSGGVKAPAEGVREFGIEHVRRGLVEEGIEELGVSLDGASGEAVAIVGDDEAASDDVLVRVRLAERINSRWGACRTQDAQAWEYVDVAWVPVGRLGAWVQQRGGAGVRAVIPPSVAVMRWLGWA